ncbi:hypothetical protein N0V82_005297 [Gnomoniopsis sp. IMI 355080]|nr:hypothetical protein N0V82_005297 [Gnomoniopsis sp. IMI 355080]
MAAFLAKQDWDSGYVMFVDMAKFVPDTISTAAILGIFEGGSNKITVVGIMIFMGLWARVSSTYGDESKTLFSGLATFTAKPGALRPSLESDNGANSIGATDIVQMDPEWMTSLILLASFAEFSNTSIASIIAMSYRQIVLPYLITSTMAAVPCHLGYATRYLRSISLKVPGEMNNNYTTILASGEAAQPWNTSTLQAKLYANCAAYRFDNA